MKRAWWSVPAVAAVLVVAAIVVVRFDADDGRLGPPAFHLSQNAEQAPATGSMVPGGMLSEYWMAVGQQYRFADGRFAPHPVVVTITDVGTRDDDGRPWASMEYRFDGDDAGRFRIYETRSTEHGLTNVGAGRLGLALTYVSLKSDVRAVRMGVGAFNTEGLGSARYSAPAAVGDEDVTLDFGAPINTDSYAPLRLTGRAISDGPAGITQSLWLGVGLREATRVSVSTEVYRGDTIDLDGITAVALRDFDPKWVNPRVASATTRDRRRPARLNQNRPQPQPRPHRRHRRPPHLLRRRSLDAPLGAAPRPPHATRSHPSTPTSRQSQLDRAAQHRNRQVNRGLGMSLGQVIRFHRIGLMFGVEVKVLLPMSHTRSGEMSV